MNLYFSKNFPSSQSKIYINKSFFSNIKGGSGLILKVDCDKKFKTITTLVIDIKLSFFFDLETIHKNPLLFNSAKEINIFKETYSLRKNTFKKIQSGLGIIALNKNLDADTNSVRANNIIKDDPRNDIINGNKLNQIAKKLNFYSFKSVYDHINFGTPMLDSLSNEIIWIT